MNVSPFAKHAHRWTEAEMRELIGMWLNDAPTEEIAMHFGVKHRSIYKLVSRIRAQGVPLPRRNAGHLAGRSNKLWTQEEVEYLIRRRNEKATAEQIGQELDRSHSAVSAMIRKLREEGVNVRMLGQGLRKLWDPAALRMAMAGRGLRLVEDELEEAA